MFDLRNIYKPCLQILSTRPFSDENKSLDQKHYMNFFLEVFASTDQNSLNVQTYYETRKSACWMLFRCLQNRNCSIKLNINHILILWGYDICEAFLLN